MDSTGLRRVVAWSAGLHLLAVTDPHRLEWENPANWRGGLLGVYVAPRDPRIWVPKKYGYGWTLNFAHRGSWYWLIGLIALPLLVVGLIALLTETHP